MSRREGESEYEWHRRQENVNREMDEPGQALLLHSKNSDVLQRRYSHQVHSIYLLYKEHRQL